MVEGRWKNMLHSRDTRGNMEDKKTRPADGPKRKTLQNKFDALLRQVQTSRVHFRNVVEKNVDGIVILSQELDIVYLNPAAETLIGEARHEYVGHKWPYEIPIEDASEEILHANTNYRRFVEMRAVETEWEGAPAILISIRDMTERKASEEKIRRLNAALEDKVARRTEQLEALNTELEAFNYAVSHDLRTPLARIDGYASLLLTEMEEKLTPDNAHFLERIRASVTQMVELTDGLLQLSRLNKRSIEPNAFSLSNLAENILETLKQDAPDRAVEFLIQPDMTVCADYVLLRAVMENLLSNAWKFTRTSDITRIRVGSIQRDNETIFFVSDNGVGFEMGESAKLFQAFQRLHADAQFPGTGIGLTTVRRIIHRHGGKVWAEAAPSEGATFLFTLPEGTPGQNGAAKA